MPKTKREASDEESEEEKVKPKIVSKLEPGEVKIEENEDKQEYISLSDKRRVTISEYRKATFVDFREYYEDKATGELKPGKKGLSLSMDQWKLLRENIGLLDEMIARKNGE